MHTHGQKVTNQKNPVVQQPTPSVQHNETAALSFTDNRPETSSQLKLQETATKSTRVSQLKSFTKMANSSLRVKDTAQRQEQIQHKAVPAVQKKANHTGLPNQLKTGIENLSGISMDDVKVHRNSSKPAQLQAHAYAQGTNIHLAPGQEKHLPHEAWHVVQQKQGRVKPTKQLKGTVNINDNDALEKEADVMGAKAMQLKSTDQEATAASQSQQKQLKNTAQPVQQVVQRYTVAHGHRIANDHTAAVKIGKNNKDLYATQGRIDNANQVLTNKKMPLSLNAGAQKNGLVDDQVLLTVTPQFQNQPSNQLPETETPKASVAHNVLLPSECEKGAISIIGAYTKTQKSLGNTRVYNDKDHSSARIGELLAQSTALAGTKTGWYNSWHDLERGVNIAVKAWNKRTYVRADIVQMFTDLNDNALRGEFNSNFRLNQAQTDYEPTYFFDTVIKARALFQKIIRRFDKKMTDIETEIMKTVDTGTNGEQLELATAANLRDQLVNFFQNRDYDKPTIDQAINLVPQNGQLLQMLQEGFRETQAGGKYRSTATFFKDSKLEAMAKTVLQSIDEHVVALTARNTKSLGNNSGLNKEVNPDIGQSYGIIGGQYNFTDDGRWNWHWASVIMKTHQDNVTMEAHATHKVNDETHNEHWDFKMYGTLVNSGQTFHDEWKDQGFGKAPLTVLGVPRDNPYYHNLANDRFITGLNAIQVAAALVSENTLYQFLGPLANPHSTKEQLIQAYQQGVPDLANLPAQFKTNFLDADLLLLNTAMQDLIGDVGNEQEQLDRTVDVNDHAIDLRKTLNMFRLVAEHYRGHKKKTGAFV